MQIIGRNADQRRKGDINSLEILYVICIEDLSRRRRFDRMKKILLYVFFVLLSLAVVYGATSFSPIQTEEVYGKKVKFCVYKGVRLLPKSVFKDYDTCEKCICRRSGLSCATLSTAFTVGYPDDSKCISVRIGCKNRWVMRNNNEKSCPKGLIPKEISMVGK